MSKHCKIEFYFKREDMQKLLDENKDAKGIVIKQEIKTRRNGMDKSFTNVTTITAYARQKSADKSPETSALIDAARPVYGCPFPPGCDAESEDLL